MELRVLFWLLALVPAQSDGAVLDLATAKIFRGDPQGAFGTQVASLKTQDGAWVLVSAPLSHVEASGLGRLYRCHPGSGTCQEVPVVGPPGAVNASLGLALDASEEGVVVCGPRVPKFCGSNVQLRGFCVLLDVNFQQFQSLPQLLPECPKASSDVVFLIDGSGSIQREDFKTMKKFIREVMLMFKDTDTQVGPFVGDILVASEGGWWHLRAFGGISRGLVASERGLVAYLGHLVASGRGLVASGG
ncbi:integrin alpha-D-like, partial [Calypte anna]|uniref:integrin alpha-D-like n=1 Tax=Calypte anna TaxID=9244 RepID=UPI0011C45532